MARKRGTETIGDMVRSIVVVLIPVAFIAGLVGLIRPSSETIRDVDWEPALDAARSAAPFTVVGPEGLPDGWTATSADYAPGVSAADGSWRLNLVTDDREYVGIIQRPGEIDLVVSQELPEYEPDGVSTVSGQSWERYAEQGRDADRALVADRGDSVVIVLGSGDYSALESFVDSLR